MYYYLNLLLHYSQKIITIKNVKWAKILCPISIINNIFYAVSFEPMTIPVILLCCTVDYPRHHVVRRYYTNYYNYEPFMHAHINND